MGVINYESSCFAHLYAKAVDDENIKAHRNYADYDCLCVTGACFMIEKAKFDKAGGFDEAFEVTHNDVDICLTLYEQGYYNVLRNDVFFFTMNHSQEVMMRLMKKRTDVICMQGI